MIFIIVQMCLGCLRYSGSPAVQDEKGVHTWMKNEAVPGCIGWYPRAGLILCAFAEQDHDSERVMHLELVGPADTEGDLVDTLEVSSGRDDQQRKDTVSFLVNLGLTRMPRPAPIAPPFTVRLYGQGEKRAEVYVACPDGREKQIASFPTTDPTPSNPTGIWLQQPEAGFFVVSAYRNSPPVGVRVPQVCEEAMVPPLRIAESLAKLNVRIPCPPDLLLSPRAMEVICAPGGKPL